MKTGSKRRTVLYCLGVVGFMGIMGWASVPLYDLFCRVTGYGGTTQVATEGADEILDQTVTIRFVGATAHNIEWDFKPAVKTMEVRIGETNLAFYEASNPTDRVIAGTASYNVTPLNAGYYFSKIDCFCFTKQVLQPGEKVMMPVSFYVDPEIVKDGEAAGIHTITLSYTFFKDELDADQAAASTKTTAATGG